MPLANQVHVDQLLSEISIKYSNAEYIADQVFPILPVKKTSDLYRTYTRNFRIPQTLRAIKGVSREFNFEVGTSTYNLEWHSLKDYVADVEADNYDISNLRADTTENLTDAILRRRELMVANLFTTSSFSLNVSLAADAVWTNDTTTANPIPLFDTGATTVIANSGHRPNYGIMGRATYVAAKNNTRVLDRVKYTSKEMSPVILAALLGVEQLLIPIASMDTSAEGAADAITSIWPTNIAFLGWKPASPSPLQPSVGYTFQKPRPMVKRWRDEERESEAIEVNMEIQPKVVASLCGYLIKGTV